MYIIYSKRIPYFRSSVVEWIIENITKIDRSLYYILFLYTYVFIYYQKLRHRILYFYFLLVVWTFPKA